MLIFWKPQLNQNHMFIQGKIFNSYWIISSNMKNLRIFHFDFNEKMNESKQTIDDWTKHAMYLMKSKPNVEQWMKHMVRMFWKWKPKPLIIIIIINNTRNAMNNSYDCNIWSFINMVDLVFVMFAVLQTGEAYAMQHTYKPRQWKTKHTPHNDIH